MTEREIFLAVLDLPDPAARSQYLDKVCGDPAQRARIESLLLSHDTADSFLGSPAANPPEPHDMATQDLGSAATPEYANEADDDLKFLDKPRRPDSLGRLGHYEMLQVLGRGGFGIVFRAFDDILQRVVAVKVMAPQIATLSPGARRFVREARSSAAIRHDNVVHVYEVGEQPLPYLVMEFIPGESLQQKLDRSGPLDVPEVLRIGRQIAEGLAAAHASDLIHRDIKPGNVLLEGGSHKAKITDFGLARAADDASISQSGVVAGTPMFMAPEQALGQHIDQRADLFSLGSVLYQMVSGRPPFRAPSTLAVLKRVAEEPPRPIPEIIPETPDWLCGIITKLHAKKPEDRFQSAREVADLLADCEAKLKAKQEVKNVLPAATVKAVKTSKPARRKWVAAAALVLLPVIALAVTEFAGVTHLFRGQATRDPKKPDSNPTPVVVAKQETPPLAIAPFDASQAKEYQNAWAKHLGVEPEITNSIGMKLRLIPPGEFTMGYTKEQADRVLPEMQWAEDKKAVATALATPARIEQPFYLGTREVTLEQFRQFVKAKGYRTTAERDGKGGEDWDEKDKKIVQKPEWIWSYRYSWTADASPVVFVTTEDARAFCAWLSALDGREYALPSDKQWEYACRAGTTTLWWTGDHKDELLRRERLGGGVSHEVGSLSANPFGLFDMHGNVMEWVRRDDAFEARGGQAGMQVYRSHSAFRSTNNPGTKASQGIGFRVVVVGDLKAPTVKQETLPPTYKNSIGMEFVIVPKGKSWLGGSKDKLGGKEVEIPADFYLGKYEVTQEEWEKVMGENPSHFSRTGDGMDAVKDISDADLKRFPVENVSWDQCQIFVEKLNALEKETGWVYRLPREAEWEYACRGGPLSDKLDSAFDFYFARPTNILLPEQANFNGELGRTRKVGAYEANRLGLFDMHGNAWEWCDDTRMAADGALHREHRGGSWRDDSVICRAARSSGTLPTSRGINVGLRLARVPSGAPSPAAKTSPQDPDRRAPE